MQNQLFVLYILRFSHQISLCEKAFRIHRGEASFSHVKKSFLPITNHGLGELCFAVIAGSFVRQL